MNQFDIDALQRKLEPCPFCGSHGILTWTTLPDNAALNDGKPLWTAKCSSQKCFMFGGIFWLTDPKESADRWNKRSTKKRED